VSLGIALATVVSGLMSPLVGLAVERLGARPVLAAAAVGMGICFALLGLTWSLVYLYAMFALMAVWRAGTGKFRVSAAAAAGPRTDRASIAAPVPKVMRCLRVICALNDTRHLVSFRLPRPPDLSC
ncbi:hypothetical protein LCGC14_2462000, partial [marine sediment metagenome]